MKFIVPALGIGAVLSFAGAAEAALVQVEFTAARYNVGDATTDPTDTITVRAVYDTDSPALETRSEGGITASRFDFVSFVVEFSGATITFDTGAPIPQPSAAPMEYSGIVFSDGNGNSSLAFTGSVIVPFVDQLTIVANLLPGDDPVTDTTVLPDAATLQGWAADPKELIPGFFVSTLTAVSFNNAGVAVYLSLADSVSVTVVPEPATTATLATLTAATLRRRSRNA